MLKTGEQRKAARAVGAMNVALRHHARDKHRPHAEKAAHIELDLKFGLIDIAKLILDLDAVQNPITFNETVKIVVGRFPPQPVNFAHLMLPDAESDACETRIDQLFACNPDGAREVRA